MAPDLWQTIARSGFYGHPLKGLAVVATVYGFSLRMVPTMETGRLLIEAARSLCGVGLC